jgi:hypothetical protein
MNQKPSGVVLPQANPDQDNRLAQTTRMISLGLIVLANLLKRGGAPALQASGGLSSVDWCVARAPAADERDQAGRGGWHGQATDQPGAGRAGFPSGQKT